MSPDTVADRRSAKERRVRRVSFRYPERRSGFDRREPAGGGLRSRHWALLQRYRDRPAVVGLVLAAVTGLSLLDLALTTVALDEGAVELNPVMAALFESSPFVAGAVKVAITAAAVATIWVLRRYRLVLETSLALFAAMTLLTCYQLAGITLTVG